MSTAASPADGGLRGADVSRQTVQPSWVRVTHWINVLAVLVLVTSGWRIYNASPIFGFTFPKQITLGGWLGGALLWHFAAMWVLFVNGLIYLCTNIVSGRLRHRFWPLTARQIASDLVAALRGHLSHDDLRQYNAVQKFAYLGAIGLMGGYDNARIVHFFAMAGLVFFTLVHVIMVALVPRTLLLMIRGR